ncbi:hypothetical protein V6N13_143148 [Hibiscus sabdariffa]
MIDESIVGKFEFVETPQPSMNSQEWKRLEKEVQKRGIDGIGVYRKLAREGGGRGRNERLEKEVQKRGIYRFVSHLCSENENQEMKMMKKLGI